MTTTFQLTAHSLGQASTKALGVLDHAISTRGSSTRDERRAQERLHDLQRAAWAIPGLTPVHCSVDDILLLLGERTIL